MAKTVSRSCLLILLAIVGLEYASGEDSGWSVSLGESTVEDAAEHDRALEGSSKDRVVPLRNAFAGIYENYKSTYLGNRTMTDYLKDVSSKSSEHLEVLADTLEAPKKVKKSKKHRKRKKKRVNNRDLENGQNNVLKYEIGPDVNVSVHSNQDIVSVDMNADYVKEFFTGDWITDSHDGRKKKDKGGFMMKILPLFILPFLIQSSIFPFLVAKLKLLLIKSIIVGKLAIFLLVISAIKNSQKVATYEPMPAYFAAEHPSRRSEGFSGYRVEGRPAALVN